MSWDLIRGYWPNAAMPFALMLLPLVAFTNEWQANAAHNSLAQVEKSEMVTVASSVVFEQTTNAFLDTHCGSISRPGSQGSSGC